MKTIIITIGGNSGNIVLDAADEIPNDYRYGMKQSRSH